MSKEEREDWIEERQDEQTRERWDRRGDGIGEKMNRKGEEINNEQKGGRYEKKVT